eukprot:gnl/TRDRNA2_/TRDRNA2_190538_c0_seq1.p1 gnl/TRDRNA2_/TRDRNA2_190538_c0~~gnl/TRDRNA2_/TRDRNA2_190538_c0_seq1.p1  ORF type:complete len:213 (+),score=43.36 gnl/TRDRNA2_/TRDRNA2_190538_c0_seq1:47-685(+)
MGNAITDGFCCRDAASRPGEKDQPVDFPEPRAAEREPEPESSPQGATVHDLNDLMSHPRPVLDSSQRAAKVAAGLTDRDGEVRMVSCELLKVLGPLGRPFIPDLKTAALHDETMWVRVEAARAIMNIDAEQLKDIDPRIVAVVKGVRNRESNEVVDALGRAANEAQSTYIRMKAQQFEDECNNADNAGSDERTTDEEDEFASGDEGDDVKNT